MAKHALTASPVYDVIIVGGGPAGSTLAWKLASKGVKIVLLDGARFPREKVCGDYIEPRGLRILDQMGGLKALKATCPLPITHSSTYIDSNREYVGKIPFYGVHKTLPSCGYIIPRDVFDSLLLEIAGRAGTRIHQQTYVTGFTSTDSGVEVQARSGGAKLTYRGRLVVGADGVNSVVARTAGLFVNDSRHIALSQRAYADGFEGRRGEAAFFFDRDFFPGYGWMFPMSHGRLNCGVGILKEACQRKDIAVPQLFQTFFEKLKNSHPHCRKLKLCAPPIGGIVKTYGAAGPNYFNRGLLIGDAGSFVDPMTGEGITPAMESALIAARILLTVLNARSFEANALSTFEDRYRSYFDPAMIFTDLCAATLRNHHYWWSWKNALIRGCELAQDDKAFAAKAGACFGGLEVHPFGIMAEVLSKTVETLFAIGLMVPSDLFNGDLRSTTSVLRGGVDWMMDSSISLLDDPVWHAGWVLDVQAKWLHTLAVMGKGQSDPRIEGIS